MEEVWLVMVDLMTGRELKRLHGPISCVAGHTP